MYDEDGDTDYGVIEDAWNITIDGGGRIILPEDLLAHAEISDTLVFIGRGHRFLVMSPVHYEAYKQRRADRRRKRRAQRDGADA